MAWQNISNSEIDANSPISSTLMGKIKNDLDELYNRSGKDSLFNNSDHDEPASGVDLSGGDWTTIQSIAVMVPADAGSLKIRLRAKIDAPMAETRKMRVALAGSFSDEHSFSTTGYEEFTLTLASPAGGLNSLGVQAYVNANPGPAYLHWLLVWAEAAA